MVKEEKQACIPTMSKYLEANTKHIKAVDNPPGLCTLCCRS